MRNHSIALILSLFLISMPAMARADGDEDDAGSGHTTRTLSLDAIRVDEPPSSPRLATPLDWLLRNEEHNEPWDWFSGGNRPGDDWMTFEGPATDRHALSPDVLRDLLYELNSEQLDNYDNHALEAREDSLFVAGRPPLVRSIEEGFQWATEGLAPALRVHASLAVKRPEERLLAEGVARLFPARWTRVVFQGDDKPFVVDWNVQIAQEATSMQPLALRLPEGEEVYLRCHPGETVTLVEVWIGCVEHVETRTLDMSPVRNVPEGNAPGTLTFPLTRVERCHTVLALPAGKATTRSITFRQDGREAGLSLRFDAPAGSHPAMQTGGPRRMAILKYLAAFGHLDFEVRRRMQDEWVDEVTSYAWATKKFDDDQFHLNPVPNGVILFGIPEAMTLVRDQIKRAEERLAPRRVSLRLVTLAENSYRTALDAGDLAPGRRVAPEVLTSLRPAGAETASAVAFDTVAGLGSGFRLGFAVAGLLGLEAEVAQQSAGLEPVVSMRFNGLSGTARIETRGRREALVVRARVAWADAESGQLEIVQRPPISMMMQHEDYREEPDRRRVHTLPLLGSGESRIDADIGLDGPAGGTYLVGSVVRGAEVQLLVATVQ